MRRGWVGDVAWVGLDGAGFRVNSGGKGGLLLAAIRLLPCSPDPPGVVYSFVVVTLLTSLSH